LAGVCGEGQYRDDRVHEKQVPAAEEIFAPFAVPVVSGTEEVIIDGVDKEGHD
jgi:hypothetical protein